MAGPGDEVGEEGACHCCLARGRFRSMWRGYRWLQDARPRRYADMLRDCYLLTIPEEGAASDTVICAICITRLRDAYNFKLQILECERRLTGVNATRELSNNDMLSSLSMKEEYSDMMGQHEDNDHMFDDDAFNIQQAELCNDEFFLEFPSDLESKLPQEFEVPLVNSMEPTKRDNDKVPENKRKKLEEIKKKTVKKKDRVKLRKTSSRALLRNQLRPVNAHASSRIAMQTNSMTINNAAQIIEYSQACPFKCRHSTYMCFYCGMDITEPQDLRTHTRTMHRGTRREIIRSIKPKNSLIKMDITSLDCKLCGSKINSIETLKNHLMNIHGKKFDLKSPDGVLPFVLDEKFGCAMCSKTFSYFQALNQHMNEHYNLYVCEICGHGFATQTRLTTHVRIHDTGNTPCDLCGKIFKTKFKLQAHVQRYHERRGTIRCPQCPMRFVEYHEKLKHLVSEHNAEPLQFKCKDCNKVFPSRRRLTTHTKRDHLLERRFHCIYCDQKFFSKFVLKNHVTRHTKDRNYKCPVCGQTYSMQKTLNEHMKKQHRNVTCVVCCQSFSKNTELVAHLRLSHPHVLV